MLEKGFCRRYTKIYLSEGSAKPWLIALAPLLKGCLKDVEARKINKMFSNEICNAHIHLQGIEMKVRPPPPELRIKTTNKRMRRIG